MTIVLHHTTQQIIACPQSITNNQQSNKQASVMHFFNKLKTYIAPPQPQPTNSCTVAFDHNNSKPTHLNKSSESYQLIMLDIIENSGIASVEHQRKSNGGKGQSKEGKQVGLMRSSGKNGENSAQKEKEYGSERKESEEVYVDLVYEIKEEEHQGIENIYMKDFIFVNKLSEARELTVDQWLQMVEQKNLSLYPKKNIYFSILKGIKFQVRKSVWELFANISQMKKLSTRPYKQLTNPDLVRSYIVNQIDKDVPRSKSITNYQKQLRNILVAYCALTRKQYTQGMNLIAGALLTLLALQNDEELGGFQIYEKQFQQRVFWIFIGVMVWKNWQDIFDKDLLGLTKRLQILQSLMAEHIPAVYQKLIDFEWDLTIFSQYYITIMLYNTPKQFSKIILDLFFLDGENALHSLIIRMMKMQEEKIIGFSDQCQLMSYFKRDMIYDCYDSVRRNQANAKKLQDFQINFMKATKN